MTSDMRRTPADLICEYRGYAREAKARAASQGNAATRALYFAVAESWTELADEVDATSERAAVTLLTPPEPDAPAAEIRRLRARAHHARQLAVHVPDQENMARLRDYAERLERDAAELERTAKPASAKAG